MPTFIIVAMVALTLVLVSLPIAAVIKLRREDRRKSGVLQWQEDHEQWLSELPPDVKDAHAHSSNHRAEILSSRMCGCFYCGETFAPSRIEEWCDRTDDEENGTTAICPFCSIDSVVGDRSGYPITKEFLGKMNSYWF